MLLANYLILSLKKINKKLKQNLHMFSVYYDEKTKITIQKLFLCCISCLLFYLRYIILLLLLHIYLLYLEYLFYAAGRWVPNMINTFRLRKYSERPPNNLTPWGFKLQKSAHF
jgi:hypothetical protein